MIACALLLMAAGVAGHGRLVEPPSRATAWRHGFDTPKNYDDNQLYCGGYAVQWQRNNGKCGICGDAWHLPRPRPHELGGKMAPGLLVRHYEPGASVELKVQLTANHDGHFEFRLCDNAANESQECLDLHRLERSDGGGYAYRPDRGNQMYSMHYTLPAGLSCDHCVLQWRYIAGNNWGMCANGSGAVGCGPQEEFRACADVSIGHHRPPSTSRRPIAPSTPTTPPTVVVVVDEESTYDGYRYHGPVVAALALLAALAFFGFLIAHHYRREKQSETAAAAEAAAHHQPPARPPRLKRKDLEAVHS